MMTPEEAIRQETGLAKEFLLNLRENNPNLFQQLLKAGGLHAAAQEAEATYEKEVSDSILMMPDKTANVHQIQADAKRRYILASPLD